MSPLEKLKAIQDILGVKADGVAGPITEAAWDDVKDDARAQLHKEHFPPEGKHYVVASSFADPKDVIAFERCKARGGSDQQCFKVGDNGVGAWGHRTAQDHTPMAALPREVWKAAGKTGGAKLRVTYNGKTVEGILGDTLPSLANIKHGVGVDLNPAFAKAFGLQPPFLVDKVEWEWA